MRRWLRQHTIERIFLQRPCFYGNSNCQSSSVPFVGLFNSPLVLTAYHAWMLKTNLALVRIRDGSNLERVIASWDGDILKLVWIDRSKLRSAECVRNANHRLVRFNRFDWQITCLAYNEDMPASVRFERKRFDGLWIQPPLSFFEAGTFFSN